MYADCTYSKTLLGTLKLTCNRDTQIWDKEGECQKYSELATIHLMISNNLCVEYLPMLTILH